MPAKTTEKGEIGEAMVMADVMRQGHDIAIPFGHNQPFDLIVIRKEDGRLEMMQVKYTTSRGKVVRAPIRSSSAWVQHRYTRAELDWVAIYEATANSCYYLPAYVWEGRTQLALRIEPTKNGQAKGINWASEFTTLQGDPQTGPTGPLLLPLGLPQPE